MWWLLTLGVAHLKDDFVDFLDVHSYHLAPTANNLWQLYVPCMPSVVTDHTQPFEQNVIDVAIGYWETALQEHVMANSNSINYFVGDNHCAEISNNRWTDTTLLFSGNLAGRLTAQDIELVARSLNCSTTLCHTSTCAGQHKCYRSALPPICVPGIDYTMTDDSWSLVFILAIVSATLIYHTFDAGQT